MFGNFVNTFAPAGAARWRRPAVSSVCRFRSFLVRFGRKLIGRFVCIFLFVRCSVLLDLFFIILRCLYLFLINWCSRKHNTLYCAFVSALSIVSVGKAHGRACSCLQVAGAPSALILYVLGLVWKGQLLFMFICPFQINF